MTAIRLTKLAAWLCVVLAGVVTAAPSAFAGQPVPRQLVPHQPAPGGAARGGGAAATAKPVGNVEPAARVQDLTIPAAPAPAPAVPAATLRYLPTAVTARPGYRQAVIDPAFGTRVTRVSDQYAMGGVDLSNRGVIRNGYAKKSAWNSDGSLLLLGSSSPAPLLGGSTYAFLRLVRLFTNPTWSNVNPAILYGIDPFHANLVEEDVRTQQATVLAHIDGYDRISLGDGEGNLSDDDRWIALDATRPDGGHDAIVYDLVTGRTVVRRLDGGTPNWIGMSHSGAYVLIGWNSAGTGAAHGVTVHDRNLTYLRTIDKQTTHGDVLYDTTGREVYVAGNNCRLDSPVAPCGVQAALSAFPLDGSTSFPVVARSTGYNPAGEHVSGRALRNPGWAYVSDFGAPSVAGTYAGHDQVFAVRVDPAADPANPVIRAFAQSHHQTGLPYASMPFAVPDSTGTRVTFGSEWGLGTPAPVLAYVAEGGGDTRLSARYQPLGAVLGAPRGYQSAVAGGLTESCTSGALFWSAATGVHEVHGPIRDRYAAAGGPAGRLGFPVTDVAVAAGGTTMRSDFTGGSVVWSAATGAQVITGPIRARWLTRPGTLGYPAGPEAAVRGVTGATSQPFAGSAMYFSLGTGAHRVPSEILAGYARAGGPASYLGLPASDDYGGTNVRTVDFTGGYIDWSAATAPAATIAAPPSSSR